jgi:hypothetical protein
MDRERKGAKRELDSARADNVALVERLRYVQGYRSKNLSGQSSNAQAMLTFEVEKRKSFVVLANGVTVQMWRVGTLKTSMTRRMKQR